eukprot:c18179_g1_i1 orf=1267-3018(-)
MFLSRTVQAEWRCDSSILKWTPSFYRTSSPPHHRRRCFTTTLRAQAGEHHQPTTATPITHTPHATSPPHLIKPSSPTESKQWVHFIGIGGAGLSALAFYALKQGWHVTGSDVSWSKKLEDLRKAGAKVHVGHHESQLWGEDRKQLPDHVVLSAAIPCTNVEFVMAQKLGIQIHKRGSWLARVTHAYDLIAISGSHGKSTTTAMLSMVLKDMGNDISAIVGADVPQFPGGGSVMYGGGAKFILEADEYDGCFLSLSPQLALITNIEWEHVDMFSNQAAVNDHFRKFCKCLKAGGTLVFCGDSDAAKLVASEVLEQGDVSDDEDDRKRYAKTAHQIISYGLGEGNVWRAVMVEPNAHGGSDYLATWNGEIMTRVQIQLPGAHNVLNSLAVIVIAAVLAAQKFPNDAELSLNAKKEAAEAASRSLKFFYGVRRRFELIGMVQGCQIYDDYAHHPTEVRACLEAARQQFGTMTPLWLVFQPHTYSRLSKLLEDFAAALAAADHVIVTEIYSAREKNVWGISGKDLVNQISGTTAVYVPGLDDVCTYLLAELAAFQLDGAEANVIIFTMGAGDISHLGPKLLQALSGV